MKTKPLLILILVSVLTFSCKVKEEQLKEKVKELESVIANQEELMNNGIYIPYDSLNFYVGSHTIVPRDLNGRLTDTLHTFLILFDLPETIKTDCYMTSGSGTRVNSVNNYLDRAFVFSKDSVNEQILEGKYVLQFPNGDTHKVEWRNIVPND